jgi:hypothetical protein
MKKLLLYIFLSFTPIIVGAQELFYLTFEQNQTPINTTLIDTNEISLAVKGSTIIVGGLNDLDGMGNYFNVYGSKLIIDSLDITSDGTQSVVLRREDGNNFFNLYSTMRAKLTPVRNLESKSIPELDIIP